MVYCSCNIWSKLYGLDSRQSDLFPCSWWSNSKFHQRFEILWVWVKSLVPRHQNSWPAWMPLDVHPTIPRVPQLTAFWDRSTTARLAIASMAWDSTWDGGDGGGDDGNDDYYILLLWLVGIVTMIYRTHWEISWTRGTPKSSILIGCSIINQPIWGSRLYGTPHLFRMWRRRRRWQQPAQLAYHSAGRVDHAH